MSDPRLTAYHRIQQAALRLASRFATRHGFTQLYHRIERNGVVVEARRRADEHNVFSQERAVSWHELEASEVGPLEYSEDVVIGGVERQVRRHHAGTG